MKNKLYERRGGIIKLLILFLCITFLTAPAAWRWQNNSEAQTVMEKRYKPELVVRSGHSEPIEAVAFSPDNKLIASLSNETIKLWDKNSGRELRTFVLPKRKWGIRYCSLLFSSDSRILVSFRDSNITLWNITSGSEIEFPTQKLSDATSMAVSLERDVIAVSYLDGTIKVWSISSKKEVRTIGQSSKYSRNTRSYGTNSDPNIDTNTDKYGTNTASVAEIKQSNAFSTAITFRNDGKTLVSSDSKNVIKIWDINTGKILDSFKIQSESPKSFELSADGRIVASWNYYKDNSDIQVWNIDEKREIFRSKSSYEKSFALSKDGKVIATNIEEKIYDEDFKELPENEQQKAAVKIWDLASGKEIKTLLNAQLKATSVFSYDGKYLAANSNSQVIALWNIETGESENKLVGHFSSVSNVLFSPDSKKITSWIAYDSSNVWDLATGQIRFLEGIGEIAFNSNKEVLTKESYVTLAVRESTSFEKLREFRFATDKELLDSNNEAPSPYSIRSIGFSPDGKIIEIVTIGRGVLFFDLATGKKKLVINFHEKITFSPDSKKIIFPSSWEKLSILDVNTGKEINSIPINYDSCSYCPVALSFDEKQVAILNSDKTKIKVLNSKNGQEITKISVLPPNDEKIEGPPLVKEFQFSPDGKAIASISSEDTIKIWDVATGEEITTASRLPEWISFDNLARFKNEDVIAVSDGNRIKLINAVSRQEIAFLYAFGEKDWAVTTPEGLFDSSNAAQSFMHFVISDSQLGYETIDFDQLKNRYYVPGLLKKIFNGEPLPQVGEFAVALYPKVQIEQSKQNQNSLDLKLENRGGGIGRVEVYLDGKQIVSDARQGKTIDTKAPVVNLPVEIPKDKLNAGANKIEVVAWNAEGDVRSRAKEFYLNLEENGTVRGTEIIKPTERRQTYDGHFYAIVAGISDYVGDNLDLRYAAKDAEDMSEALATGARRLFCAREMREKKPCERVHVRTLSTEKEPTFGVAGVDFKRAAPTKQNFREAFAEIASKAKPEDVVVIYFAGHGTAIKSDDALRESAFPDLYLYPTVEAMTIDKVSLSNRDLRERTAISSLEIADWVNQIKAEKSVMIFDTCAAGAVQVDLTKQARADDGEQIRALDRLRERTGFYVLMGSAADAVSYEASNFRQGLLTYSLLEAMTGARLREDKFVDVEDWFKYAEEKVDSLAKGIGGIQRPRYFKSNFNAQSFDVGEINLKEDKIPVARPVPVILQPVLLDKTQLFDSLNLAEMLIPKLREMSVSIKRGESGAINYVAARAAKGGISPSGIYTVSGDAVTVELVLRQDEKEIVKIEVKGTKNDIAEKVLKAIISAAQRKN